VSTPVLELSGVVQNYHAIRPLRIDRLSISPGEHVALLGIDQHAAEVFINLATGAMLPEQGAVSVLGRPTSGITDSTEWLAVVDRFGIVSERAVLLEPLTVIQNLVVPFSLDIEPPSDALRERAIALAREVGLDERDWDRRLGDLDGTSRLKVRLARALALDPAIVLLEHPSANLARVDVPLTAGRIRGVLERRLLVDGHGLASLTLSGDREFADEVATRVLMLDPASGRLTERRRRRWFGGGTASL
jgi:ABC-type transporter Mla maintaining outer membrane lipid asymmetry ATPase subunit MlaF